MERTTAYVGILMYKLLVNIYTCKINWILEFLVTLCLIHIYIYSFWENVTVMLNADGNSCISSNSEVFEICKFSSTLTKNICLISNCHSTVLGGCFLLILFCSFIDYLLWTPYMTFWVTELIIIVLVSCVKVWEPY